MSYKVTYNMPRTPTYLICRNGIYYFNMRAPEPKQGSKSAGKRRIITRSTRTGNRRDALRMARVWWLEVMSKTSADILNQIDKAGEENRRKILRGRELESELRKLELELPEEVECWTEDLNPEDAECLLYYQMRLEEHRNQNKCSQQGEVTSRAESKPISAAGAAAYTLEEVVEKWFEMKKSWSDNTRKKYRTITSRFLFLIGNPYCDKLTKVLIRDGYAAKLVKLPKDIDKKAIFYRNGIRKPENRKTIEEIIEIADANDMPTIQKVSEDARAIKSFLKWADDKDYIEGGIAISQALNDIASKDADGEGILESAFSLDEVRTILTSEPYRKGLLKEEPHCHWFPLIAAYSGMRIAEIAKLHPSDVYKDKATEIWAINVHIMAEGKSTKTKSSIRRVPIHRHLIDLGFLDYVEQQKRLGAEYLFPDAGAARDGQNVRYWLLGASANNKTGLLEQLGIVAGYRQRKTFHSFRHTVINYFKQNEKEWRDRQVAHEIAGHAVGRGSAHEGYEGEYNLPLRKQVIDRIDYGFKPSELRRWQRLKK